MSTNPPDWLSVSKQLSEVQKILCSVRKVLYSIAPKGESRTGVPSDVHVLAAVRLWAENLGAADRWTGNTAELLLAVTKFDKSREALGPTNVVHFGRQLSVAQRGCPWIVRKTLHGCARYVISRP